MSAPPHVLLERVDRVAPFGLGLWDTAAGRLVSEGVSVQVVRLSGDGPTEWVAAAGNRRGIFVAHRLPSPPAPPTDLMVEVRDGRDRFIPFVLRIELPAKGITSAPCTAELTPPDPSSSPPGLWTYVPLFSAPTRTVPAGLAAVRATLIDGSTGEPAAAALLEVRESGDLVGRGMADESGQVVAVFPYPQLPGLPPPTSPPASSTVPSPLSEQSWSLELRVRYRRGLPRYRTAPERPALVELCEVARQPLAAALTTADSPPRRVAVAQLSYGEELVLPGQGPGRRVLFVTPV